MDFKSSFRCNVKVFFFCPIPPPNIKLMKILGCNTSLCENKVVTVLARMSEAEATTDKSFIRWTYFSHLTLPINLFS